MLNPWLTLGTGAFVISFVISLLMTRDLGSAIVSGSLAVATAFMTAAAVNWYHNQSADSRIATLKQQIRLLQHRRAEEQQAVLEIAAEKERTAITLTSMQEQLRQRQLSGFSPFVRPALSWDLSSQTTESSTRFSAEGYADNYNNHSDELKQFVAEASATRQKINASLNHLQAELSQLNAQINEQQTVREQLSQDITQLSDQKQALITTTTTLKTEISELERCRTELDNYIAYVEAKKQELESGSNPLQKALKQLQDQVNALQEELNQLETEVTAKRTEKERLDRELLGSKYQKSAAKPVQESVQTLEAQKAELERSIATLNQQQETLKNTQEALQSLDRQKAELEQAITKLQQQQAALQETQENLQALEKEKVQLEHDLAGLKQQQDQLQRTQENLQKLEQQIGDRRKEKESLERQITQLQAQKTSLRHQPSIKDQSAKEKLPKEPPSRKPSAQKHISEEKLRLSTAPEDAPMASEQRNGKAQAPATSRLVEAPTAQASFESEPNATQPNREQEELPDAWTDFMLQLPEHEVAALKAIAQESNPTRIVNRIAEDNFTTASELIHSINRLAEEIVGEPVIKNRSNFSPPTLYRSHVKTIKKLIKTYEYLME